MAAHGDMRRRLPAQQKFEKYLLSYCDGNTKSSLEDGTPVHPGVKPYAQYVITKVRKSAGLGPRHEVPIAAEIQATIDRAPVIVRVHFLDNKYKLMLAESWTTVRDLNAMVARKLNLKDPQPFALFETSSLEEERYLDEDERVLDLLAAWTKDHQEAKSKKNKDTAYVPPCLQNAPLFQHSRDRSGCYQSRVRASHPRRY